MRMWLVNPKIMCRQHLLGEHVEIHMMIGHLKKKRNIKNFINNNLYEITSIEKRHDELVNEMLERGYKHNSDIEYIPDLSYLDINDVNYKMNKSKSLNELLNRCERCRK